MVDHFGPGIQQKLPLDELTFYTVSRNISLVVHLRDGHVDEQTSDRAIITIYLMKKMSKNR